jgi:hypothetical protein
VAAGGVAGILGRPRLGRHLSTWIVDGLLCKAVWLGLLLPRARAQSADRTRLRAASPAVNPSGAGHRQSARSRKVMFELLDVMAPLPTEPTCPCPHSLDGIKLPIELP